MVSEKGLQQFIDLYKQEYSVRLTRQEAFNLFTNLINLVKITYGSPKKANNQTTQK